MMTILIEYSKGYTEGFITWLVNKIKLRLLYNIKRTKLIPFDNYLNNFDNPFKELLNINNISCYTMLVYGIKNLTYIKTKKGYLICINPFKYVPYSKIRLKSFCKFINNGVFGLIPYPIISDQLNSVKANLTEYYEEYEKETY